MLYITIITLLIWVCMVRRKRLKGEKIPKPTQRHIEVGNGGILYDVMADGERELIFH